MSKAKKIISMLLAVVMVVSVAPVSAMAAADANPVVDGVTYNTPTITTTSYTVDTTATTEVIRVAASSGSFSLGDGTDTAPYTIVKATPSGIPYNDGTYAHVAYAGETPVQPEVVFTIDGKTLAEDPTIVASVSGVGFGTMTKTTSGTATTYKFPVQGSGSLLAPHTDVVFTITYKIGSVSYTAYAYSHIENIIVMNGFINYHKVDNSTGTLRYSAIGQFQSANMYTRMNTTQNYENVQQSDGTFKETLTDDLGGTTGSGTIGYINYASTAANQGNVLLGCGSEGELDSSMNAYGSSVPNDTLAGTEQAALYVYSQVDSGEYSNKGTGDDYKLGEPIIYMDYNDTLQSLNFRMTIQNAEASDFYSLTLNSVEFFNPGTDAGVGDETSSVTGNVSTDYITTSSLTYGNTSSATIGSADFSLYLMAKFAGRGPKGQYMDAGTAVNQADTSTGDPFEVWVDLGASGDNRTLYSLTRMNLVFRNYDTRDLRTLYEGTQLGTGSTTCVTPSYAGIALEFNKGVTPRREMYNMDTTQVNSFTGANYTGQEYDNYVAALKKAGSVLAQPDTSQAEIDQAALDLYNAYYALPTPYSTVNYTINHYLTGTTTPVKINGVEVAAQTGTASMGSVVTSKAASIVGHKAVGTTTYSTDITGKYESVEINYYYEPENYNITYYYNNPSFLETDGTVNSNDMVGYSYNTELDIDAIDKGTREYYDFLGWYDSNYDVYADSFSATKINDGTSSADLTVTEDRNLYALWKIIPINVNVTPITNQGAELTDYNGTLGDPVQLTSEDEVITGFTDPGDYKIDGYFFGGYYYNYDADTMTFSDPVDWSTITFAFGDADKEVYARMIDVNGTISFFSNGGSDISDISFNAGDTVSPESVPTRKGYTFKGWWNEDFTEQYFEDGTEANGWTDGTEYMESNTGFLAYALWEANIYSITFDMGDSTSDFDTTTEQMPILQGAADSAIDPDDVPPAPTKFGKSFAQWVIKGTSTVFTFDKYPTEDIVLEPVWNSTKYSAFVSIGAYEKLSGEYVEVVNPTAADREGAAQVDDIVTFRMTSQTNFYTGSSVFVFMYDKNFFELVADGTDAFLLNSENEYVKGIDATAIGVTDDTLMDRVWPDTENMDRSTYNAMMVTIDPTVTTTNYNCEPMADGTWLVEFQLRVKDTAGTGEGTVYMHNDWTRTANNIMGTMFYGWAESKDTSVADTYNNVVEPNLDKATATIVIDTTPQNETTLIADPNGGTWADGSTDPITYTGYEGNEILDYVSPEREGYTLTGWVKSDDDTVSWEEEGYYAKESQDGYEFTAQWTANNYTVNYYLEEGSDELWDSEELPYETPIDGPFYDIEKTGYDFAGWVDSEGNAVTIGETLVPLGGIDLYGTWTPGTVNYTITVNYFNNNTQADATLNRTKTALTGSNVYIVETAGTDASATYVLWSELPTINGYEFDPDNEANQALATTPAVIAADGSTIINVYYKAKTITYTFNANGGAYADASTTQTISGEFYTATADKVAALETPTREGYDFKGWGASATATGTTTVRTNFTADTTYYAVWTAKTAAVLFDAGEGTFTDGASTTTVTATYDKAITAPTAPTRTGYNFLGWSTDGSTVLTDLGTMKSTTDNEVVFYAVWEIASFDVTYMLDGEQYSTATVEYNSTITVAEYPTDIIGYSFDGWYYNGTKYAAGDTITMPASAVVFEGNFVEDTFEATFNANGGKFSDDTDTYTVEVIFGGSITAPSNPTRSGYEFLGWAEAADSNTTVTVGSMDTEGKTYYAVWKATIWDYTIEFYYMDTDGNYGEAATDETITASGNVATVVTYDPATKTGFTVDTDASTLSGTVTVDPALVLKVYYSRNQHTVTWIESLNGTVHHEETLYYGEAIVAPTYNVAGYTWSSTTPSIEETMGDADQTYTMNITPNKYDVIFNAGEGLVDGAATKTISANYNATLESVYNNITSVTREGYALSGWSYTEDGAVIDLATETVPLDGVTLYAVWEIQSYTVNFRAGNGTFAETGTNTYSTTVTYGEAIPEPAAPTRTGYEFTGWSPAVPDTMPAAIQNFTAQWSLESYTVKFVIDDTTIEETYEYGADITAPDETQTVKTGYTFQYWMDEDGNEVEIPETMEDIGENGAKVTYTAYFTINSYNVTWNNEDGSAYEGPVSYEYGAAVAKPATDPSKTGYTFKGWKSADGTLYGENEAVPAMGTADVTYTAYFEINSYTVTWNFDNGDEAQVDTYDYMAAVTKPADPTKTGYTFAGWSPEVPSTMPAENVTVTAQWTINQYTITFDTDGGSTVEAITQDYATAVTAPADPTKTGYTFAGWSPEVPSTMPAENVTVTAQWAINSYTVTWISDGETIEEKEYNYGATVTRPSNPTKTGHTFAGWVNNDGVLYGVGVDVPAMGAADVTYTAKWDIDSHTVTWLNEDGTTYDTASYEYGADVAKPATDPTKTGYTFQGWKAADGTLYGENDAVPAMGTENVSYTAYFVINQYVIVFDAADGTFTDGSSTYTIEENYNTMVTKPADPTLEGHTFKGWTTTENGTEADIVTVPATWYVTDSNINYYAVWEVNVYTVTFLNADGETHFTVELDYGTVIESPEAYDGYTEDPTLEHYTFEGWSLTEVALEQYKEDVAANVIDFATANVTVPEGGITIYPVFARVVVTLAQQDGSTAIVTLDETSANPIVGYITGLETRLTKAKLLSTYLTVEGDGRLEVTLTKYKVCGTGARVNVIDNVTEEIVETYYIIIYGDVNGDSGVDATDSSMIGSEAAGLTTWSNTASDDYDYCKVVAADVVDENPATTEKEGMITAQDSTAIEDVTLMVAKVDQQTGTVVYSA